MIRWIAAGFAALVSCSAAFADTVTYFPVNSGAHPHTVTDRGGKFDSGDIAPGGTYSVTFQTPGTYRYYCKHHQGMEGTIVVGAGGPAPGGSKGAGY